jgi:uncharacterized damage-inducible protein DinB
MSNTDPKHLQQMFAYHHWASDRIHDALADVTGAELEKPWSGNFGTGRALLRHVVGVEWLWVERFGGVSPAAIPEPPAGADARWFRAEWEKSRPRQAELVRGVSAARLAAGLTFKNLKGEEMTHPLGELMTHVVNHGTYHRGQLSHLLRDLGRKAPGTDYLVWLGERKKA